METVQVFQAFLGLEKTDYLAPDLLWRKVQGRLESVERNTAAGLILFLALTLHWLSWRDTSISRLRSMETLAV